MKLFKSLNYLKAQRANLFMYICMNRRSEFGIQGAQRQSLQFFMVGIVRSQLAIIQSSIIKSEEVVSYLFN